MNETGLARKWTKGCAGVDMTKLNQHERTPETDRLLEDPELSGGISRVSSPPGENSAGRTRRAISLPHDLFTFSADVFVTGWLVLRDGVLAEFVSSGAPAPLEARLFAGAGLPHLPGRLYRLLALASSASECPL